MSRVVSRAIPLASRSALRPNKPFRCFRPPPPPPSPSPAAILRRRILLPVSSFHADGGRVGAPRRSYGSLKGRASKRRQAVKPLKERELLLDVKICIEEDLPDDPEILRVAETLRVDVPVAMKVAFENLSDSRYKTRDTSIGGLGGFEKVELSVMLCNDDFIQKLNKEWRDEDRATDVLSMSQHIPELDIPILMMGDVVISVETAARQAEERGHTLLDEIRILMVPPK
ncbi:hypothetical protein QJS10_CPB18g00976 [Acorus calamus]|uniref:Uncharacterized protein n=1 Tax=Acorus calamus TaxID=4465 RepID=A0AAV9CM68_ACOCL|nr:hypothetical protein QJS10_CPB18g00976 [Acorus calamus]